MHAVHLHWWARHCWGFYIYAWAFALQSGDRALVVRLGILKPRSIPPRATTEFIETPAFALGFLLLGACFYTEHMFNRLVTYFECTKPGASSCGTVYIADVV